MYVIGISGSPRKDGNTDTAVKYALELLEQNESIQTNFLRVYDYDIQPCLGCRECMKKMTCVIDDEFDRLWGELSQASIAIIGAPVYWYAPPGKMKDFIDRTHGYYGCPNGRLAKTKVGIITVAADSGFEEQETIMKSWLRHYGAELVGNARVFALDKNDLIDRKLELAKIESLVEKMVN